MNLKISPVHQKLINILGHIVILIMIATFLYRDIAQKNNADYFYAFFLGLYFVGFVFWLNFYIKIKEFVRELTLKTLMPYLIFLLVYITTALYITGLI